MGRAEQQIPLFLIVSPEKYHCRNVKHTLFIQETLTNLKTNANIPIPQAFYMGALMFFFGRLRRMVDWLTPSLPSQNISRPKGKSSIWGAYPHLPYSLPRPANLPIREKNINVLL